MKTQLQFEREERMRHGRYFPDTNSWAERWEAAELVKCSECLNYVEIDEGEKVLQDNDGNFLCEECYAIWRQDNDEVDNLFNSLDESIDIMNNIINNLNNKNHVTI